MICRLALFVLLTSFLFLIAGVAQEDPRVAAREDSKAAARAELNAGVQAFRQGNYEEAIDHYNHAVYLDAELTIAHQRLATAYTQMFLPGLDTPENAAWATRALKEYSKVLQSKPSDVAALKGTAYLNIQLKNFDQAKENYKKAIAVDPSDPELFFNAGVADWSMADRDMAAEKAKLNEESGDELFLAPGCLDARKAALANIDDGVAMLTKAISLRENYDDAMAYMDLLYRLRADLECGDREAHSSDLKKADEWTDQAMAAKAKRVEGARKSNQDSADTPPQ